MKIRNGFVSNSSSSSFLIYGICIDESELEMKDGEDPWDAIDRIFEGKFSIDQPYDSLYIGESWSDIKDDETGAEFKQRIEKTFEKGFGHKVECGTHSEAWMNG